ncbi:hypothetical protein C8T65DRAFT_737703 [Cerioporus squamosus]|nr:hypothetical protein C8T65DRAFT_737703 [Cerioporus squamosus]
MLWTHLASHWLEAELEPRGRPPIESHIRPQRDNVPPGGGPSSATELEAGLRAYSVIGSPRQRNKVSVIYEDGASYGGPASARTSSFITAPSISLNATTAEPGQRFSFGHELGPNVYLNPSSFASDSARGESMTTDADETPHATHPAQRLPVGLYDDVYLGGADEFGQMPMHASRPTSRSSLRPGNPTPSIDDSSLLSKRTK